MRQSFPLSALHRVTDPTPVEHVGGPDDGRMLPITLNARRLSGLYVPVNVLDGAVYRVVEMRWVPDA